MRKIGELLPKNPRSIISGARAAKGPALVSMISNQTNTDAPKAADYDLRMDVLFTRLGAMYGQLWWNNYRTESLLLLAKQEWSEGLQRFDNQILKEVLVTYREQKTYPPSLPQFVECCKAALNRRIPAPLRDDSKRSPNQEVAKQHIKAMLMKLKN